MVDVKGEGIQAIDTEACTRKQVVNTGAPCTSEAKGKAHWKIGKMEHREKAKSVEWWVERGVHRSFASAVFLRGAGGGRGHGHGGQEDSGIARKAGCDNGCTGHLGSQGRGT